MMTKWRKRICLYCANWENQTEMDRGLMSWKKNPKTEIIIRSCCQEPLYHAVCSLLQLQHRETWNENNVLLFFFTKSRLDGCVQWVFEILWKSRVKKQVWGGLTSWLRRAFSWPEVLHLWHHFHSVFKGECKHCLLWYQYQLKLISVGGCSCRQPNTWLSFAVWDRNQRGTHPWQPLSPLPSFKTETFSSWTLPESVATRLYF